MNFVSCICYYENLFWKKYYFFSDEELRVNEKCKC